MGFSPFAIFSPPRISFFPHRPKIRISSTLRPRYFTYTVWPPITLPEPGITLAVVTPPASAMRMPGSSALNESMARTAGWTGPLISLPSELADTDGRLYTPTCECVSTSPGMMTAPFRSISVAPAGTSTFSFAPPTRTIFPPFTIRYPASTGLSAVAV